MKKIVCIVMFAFALIPQMNAQVIQGTSSSRGDNGDIVFGLKAGLNVSALRGDNNLSFDAKLGFHIGAIADIPYGDKISIQPEVLISLQGSGGFFQDDINFWYLTIPVVGKYNVWDALYIEAGPHINILVSDNLEGNAFGGVGNQTFDATNSFDFGFNIGAGYRLNDEFYFQVRLNAGFINTIKDISSKNRVLQFSAVYVL